MCGIAGIIGLECTDLTKRRMLESMKHRGPDGEGIYEDASCALLHTRLSVIDPETGSQPMILAWGNERYILVYNGELYNTDQLRRELEGIGHKFIGHSDTEVVLHAYVQWKESCLDRFNGIFAFGIWEQHSRKLFLARDRIGVKPLFFTEHKDGILFASEMKTLLLFPTLRPMLDGEGVSEILLLGPGRTPGGGVFHGIRELEPGQFGSYHSGKFMVKRYWYLADREHRESFEETADHTRWLVEDAICRQMISDVPLGTFLSGGLDSSLITGICAGVMTAKGDTLQTFSVDYENNDQYFVPGKFQPNSDSEFIRIMTDAVRSDHHCVVLTPQDLMDELEQATIARDLPGMADVDFSLLAFSRRIRKNVTVALSGECADETFGGYPWYRDPQIRAADGFPWSQNAAQRSALMAGQLTEGRDPLEYIKERYLATCRESDIRSDASATERRMKEMVNLNFRWFMQTLLDRKDRMSMAASLEVRVPFCDYRIAEYMYSVPWEFKNFRDTEKGLLRYAMRGIIPDEILWRKKSPYPKTFDPRFRDLVADRFRELLQNAASPLWYMTNKSEAEKLLTSEHIWPWYGQLMRGTQTMLYLLQTDFWLRHYRIDFTF